MTAQDVACFADEGLASIIPLAPHRQDASADRRAPEILDRRVGPGWEGLPADAGRPGLLVEHLVRQAPCGFDPADTPAVAAITRASQVAHAARTAVELLDDDVAVLSEALGADLGPLSLDELDAVAAAVVALGSAPRAVPAWGNRATADSAALVLDLVAPDLRMTASAHERLYEQFTDHVWEIPGRRLAAATRRWRLISRRHLRRQLLATSRTGALPGRVSDVAQELVELRAMRAQLAPVRPLLANYLGDLDRGVLTDVEAAMAALTAVRDLQRALALLHDHERMERLVLADAFRTPELLVPAWSIRRTLSAWSSDVAAAGGRGALVMDGDTLGAWSGDLERVAPLLDDGIEQLERAIPGVTLQRAVDAFVLREHVARVPASDVPAAKEVDRGWSAS